MPSHPDLLTLRYYSGSSGDGNWISYTYSLRTMNQKILNRVQIAPKRQLWLADNYEYLCLHVVNYVKLCQIMWKVMTQVKLLVTSLTYKDLHCWYSRAGVKMREVRLLCWITVLFPAWLTILLTLQHQGLHWSMYFCLILKMLFITRYNSTLFRS